MPIGYDNAAECCLRNPDIESGHWFLSPDDVLYIVPRDGEVEGPDDETLDKLNAAYRRIGFEAVDPVTLAGELGLTVAYEWQHRFDTAAGYYTA